MSGASFVHEQVKAGDVVVFSKSYCPFCKKAVKFLKAALGEGIVNVLEIEDRSDCDEIQNELLKVTGGRSVPRVFIKGEFIGGCDDVTAMSPEALKAKL